MYSHIIHYHLHKTAGTTINRWLDLTTSADRARPAHFDRHFFAELEASGPLHPPGPDRDLQHGELGRVSRAYWEVIHGHSFGLVPADPHAYVFVILREPVDRYLSFLRDWRRCREVDIARMPEGVQSIRRDALHLDASAFLLRHGQHPMLQALSQAQALARVARRLGSPALPVLNPASASALDLGRMAWDQCDRLRISGPGGSAWP
ncbi:MAG: hypothetical protein VKO00_07045 [Cyanobacteriota bacterium]|nr:hypothetical protein [Cyanobacteriota bacterium]